MKIAAIFPGEIKQDIELDLSSEQPLGIAYVAQAAKDAGHEVSLYHGSPHTDELMGYDVLAFSSLTKDIPATIDLTKRVKKHKSEIITVVGGSHVSGDPKLVLQDSIDYGVLGEGESTFVDLLDVLGRGKSPDSVKGVVYKKQGDIVPTDRRERLDPTGLRPTRIDDFYAVYDPSLYYPAPSERRFVPTIASRGCSMGCEFCDSELIWGKKVVYRKPQDIMVEIEELHQDENDIFFFEDDNFFFDWKKAGEIIESIAQEKYNMASLGDIRRIERRMLGSLRQAGWVSLLWGVESVNPYVVAIEKNLTPDKIYDILSSSENLGIFNHALAMIGFDYEKETDILKYGSKLAKYPIHQLRLSIVTPFPGTAFHKRLKREGYSFNADLSKWDTKHLVYDHPTINPERMKELQHKIVEDFYRSPEWDRRIYDMARRFPRLGKSIDDFRCYISDTLECVT